LRTGRGCRRSAGGSTGASTGGGPAGYGAVPTNAKPANTGMASVGLATSDLGKILVNGSGRTLYLFEGDKGSASRCNGACASVWPPLTTSGMPSGVHGVHAGKLGAAKRSDGTSGVTYNGHPLYTYSGDTAPGTATGEGSDDFGAHWYVVSPAGDAVQAAG
jgi:predicted lipoprotein with Yx(FWY)xxD motif